MAFILNRSTERSEFRPVLIRTKGRSVCRKFPSIEISTDGEKVWRNGERINVEMYQGLKHLTINGDTYRFCDIFMYTFDYPEYKHSSVCALDGDLNNISRTNLFWARLLIEDMRYLGTIMDFREISPSLMKCCFKDGWDGYITPILYGMLVGIGPIDAERHLDEARDFLDEEVVRRKCGRIDNDGVVYAVSTKITYGLYTVCKALSLEQGLFSREEGDREEQEEGWDDFIHDVSDGYRTYFYIGLN